jgi:hypothetical protein
MKDSYVRLNEQSIMIAARSCVHVNKKIGAYEVVYLIWFGAFINHLN